ncbi:MAG: hypothetical protein EON47_12595, partial [Acetobacteraceae bacterium]
MTEYLPAGWQAFLAATDLRLLLLAWAYPIACGLLLGLAVLAGRSVLAVSLVALPLLPGFLPEAGGTPQALALVLAAIALAAGFAERRRREATEAVLRRIAAQDARLEEFCTALDRRAKLVDRHLLT